MKKIFFIVFVIVLFSACNKNSLKIDVSKVNLKLDVKRFDLELFNTPIDSLYYKIPEMQKNYGDFLDIYFVQVLGLGRPEQKDFYSNLQDFFYYCDQISLTEDVWDAFPPGDDFVEKSLTDAFKHFKYYWPNAKIPKIYTEISGFNVSVFTGNDFIAISLDKYLGKNYKAYKAMFDGYLRRRMEKENLPIDVMRAYATYVAFPFNDSVNTVMTNMIYQGRLQYFLDAMFPEAADTLKWGYTYMQWGWANEYEKKIWDFMVDQKVLFSTNSLDIKTYTGEGPFTTPFKNNSAPRAGTFIGYKIVQSYMKNNKVSLQELMSIRDYMKIYNNSNYMP